MAGNPTSPAPGDLQRAAEAFLLHAIQEWGDEPAVKIRAVQGYLDAAGFTAVATCAPVFGGILPEPMGGEDGRAATAWLRDLLNSPGWRGRFQDEVKFLIQALVARRG